jgi:hypothetical protein
MHSQIDLAATLAQTLVVEVEAAVIIMLTIRAAMADQELWSSAIDQQPAH